MTTKIEIDFFNDVGRLITSRTVELPPNSQCFIDHRGQPEVVEIEKVKGRSVTWYDAIVTPRDEETSRALVCIRNPDGVDSRPSAFLRKANGSTRDLYRERISNFPPRDLQQTELKRGDKLMIRGGLNYEAVITQE